MTLRETYARDICQNPGVPLEDCPRRDEHYALVDERLAGLRHQLVQTSMYLGSADAVAAHDEVATIVAALEDRT